MPNYADTYDLLAREAVSLATVKFDSLVERLANAGLTDDQIIERVLSDFRTGGPVFGDFKRDLKNAGKSTVSAARGQGQAMGQIKKQKNLRTALSAVGITDVDRFLDGVIDEANPDSAFDVEEITKSNRFLMWVAVLQNTCSACLPLHGVVKSAQEWEELGLDPSTIHQDNNIKAGCKCTFVEDTDQARVLQPLRRAREEKGVSKKTVRLIGSKNLGVSQEARDKALQTETGRRTLRLLGQVNKDE